MYHGYVYLKKDKMKYLTTIEYWTASDENDINMEQVVV